MGIPLKNSQESRLNWKKKEEATYFFLVHLIMFWFMVWTATVTNYQDFGTHVKHVNVSS